MPGASRLFEAHLAKHPDSYEALWGLAVAYFKKGRTRRPGGYIEKALANSPSAMPYASRPTATC